MSPLPWGPGALKEKKPGLVTALTTSSIPGQEHPLRKAERASPGVPERTVIHKTLS